MSEKSQTTTSTKVSSYVLMIVLVALVLSIVALISAANFISTNFEFAMYLLLIGLFAMGLSVYVLFQSRKRAASMKIEAPKVMTTIECRKCGIKNVREFQRGDYVYKDLDPCQKCDDKMIITAIYKEVKEKEKTYGV
jgi:ABC-type multidrug transport system fused ATPase/permease subunit